MYGAQVFLRRIGGDDYSVVIEDAPSSLSGSSSGDYQIRQFKFMVKESSRQQHRFEEQMLGSNELSAVS